MQTGRLVWQQEAERPRSGPESASPATSLTHPTVCRTARAGISALLLRAILVFVLAPPAEAQPASVSLVSVAELGENNPAIAGDQLLAAVGFDKSVEVTGAPTLEMVIGATSRAAIQVNVHWVRDEIPPALADNPCKDPECFVYFMYVVQESDLDTDGISIPRDALRGTITGTDGTPAELDLGSHAISNDPSLRVDGSRSRAPRLAVTGHSVPLNGHTYLRGERIHISLAAFDTDLVIDGSPRLAIIIGDATRWAALDPLNTGYRHGNFDLSFAYIVDAGDFDEDGIEVPENPIDLNGGSIRTPEGIDVNLSIDAHAFGPNTKVDGGVAAPTALTLSAAPAPAEGGDPVILTATLDEPAPLNVTVELFTDGTATLDMDYTLSSSTITIHEGQRSGTATLTVVDDMEDDDGETIALRAHADLPVDSAELTLTIEDNDVAVPALPLGGAMLLGLLLLCRGARDTMGLR